MTTATQTVERLRIERGVDVEAEADTPSEGAVWEPFLRMVMECHRDLLAERARRVVSVDAREEVRP